MGICAHAKLNIFDVDAYRRRLKPGQIKPILVYEIPEGDTKAWVDAEILEVYRHIAKVGYWIKVKGSFALREIWREDTVKIKDLILWEMYGNK